MIGVAQLCNKIVGVGFSEFDEEVAQAFSVYCGISIVHVSMPFLCIYLTVLIRVVGNFPYFSFQSLLYQRVRDAQLRSKLSNELMIYHMRVSFLEFYKMFAV